MDLYGVPMPYMASSASIWTTQANKSHPLIFALIMIITNPTVTIYMYIYLLFCSCFWGISMVYEKKIIAPKS